MSVFTKTELDKLSVMFVLVVLEILYCPVLVLNV